MNDSGEDDQDAVIGRLHSLHETSIRWLAIIILSAVLGIIFIAFLDSSLIDIVTTDETNEGQPLTGIATRGGQTDQAVAILGNIASAGIGGLVGWVTRDFTLRYRGVRLDAPPSKES